MYLIPILLPVFGGFSLIVFHERLKRCLHAYALAITCAAAAATWALIIKSPDTPVTFFRFTEALSFTLKIDGMSRVFAGLVSILWIPTTVYAFEYMKHEGRKEKFFTFFLMSFGIVIGLAFSANLFTLYLFYEYLSFATLPLVMHKMDSQARYAGKRYLIFMVFGGALVFVALLFFLKFAPTLDFVAGGVLDLSSLQGQENLVRAAFVVALIGFGVKAAIFPLHLWLPSASVAPTPVTALLHAVAVVKSGVFAIARVVFFSFGVTVLSGSFAQTVMMCASIFTILFGSVMALRTPHVKRRLAYSTVSNLSYMLFAISLMTEDGLTGAFAHLLVHAVVKISLFFCAGAVLYRTGVEYASDMNGMGRRMPVTMACFTVAALGLVGIPPLGAFQSKFLIASAAAATGAALPMVGVCALILSEVLTLLYLFSLIVRAYFAAPASEALSSEDPSWLMKGPLIALCALSLLMALFFSPLRTLLSSVLL